MTEMTPVAWRWTFDDGTIWHCGTEEPGKFRFGDPDKLEPLVTLSQAQSLLEEGDKRIEELEAEKWQVRHVDTANDLVSMGMARDAAEARAEAAEALLFRLMGYVPEECFEGSTRWELVECNRPGGAWFGAEDFRAARSLLNKIQDGGKGE